MAQIIECVPNFSEGRNQQVIDAISKSIKSVTGVSLLDVDPGKSTNRTVYTFVGTAEGVVEAAMAASRTAYELIDMTKQSGEHPRLGALDVCPFIPVSNATLEDCVACAKMFSERLAKELDVPVYLYGFASERDYRKQVPQIRAGEYEGLSSKITKEEWKPDYGPADFRPKWGATIAGARKFLIAYNINLLSTKEQAHRIALNIREQGRSAKEPGRLKGVQGIGWWYDEGKIAQVSTNLTDLDVTSLHQVWTEVNKDATELQIPVMGSEIVGLVPLKPMIDVAEYFIEKENLFVLEEEQKVQLAVNRLGLTTLSPFHYKTRIIEYAVDNSGSSPLLNKTVREFISEVAVRKPAPGGGSVAALIGSLGAGLCRMVGLLSSGNKKFEHLEKDMRRLVPVFHAAMIRLSALIDADTRAFNSIIEANRLPSGTPELAAVKTESVQKATLNAIEVPMETAKVVNSIWDALVELAAVANITAISDLQVGAKSLETAVYGAVCNVKINLPGLDDVSQRDTLREEAEKGLETCRQGFVKSVEVIESRIKSNSK
ncbi:hypothetical protein RvY_10515 [Ramazzottius varieornatus]|uniref:Formimidoyltransferase-cyclodeaminase n=1 Tax=Ramazzottius varieornatus TaxID=947166 RepID=A0A1D1VKS3_RAMVA|nr:hypothetical protein RvY_10515 [Ramazzottius varieornatus]